MTSSSPGLGCAVISGGVCAAVDPASSTAETQRQNTNGLDDLAGKMDLLGLRVSDVDQHDTGATAALG
jgi:hypothetical protein